MYRASEVQQRYGYDPRQFDLSRIATWESLITAALSLVFGLALGIFADMDCFAMIWQSIR